MTDSAEADSTPPQQPKSTGGAARVTPLGIYDKPRPDAITSIEVIAIALSAIWLLGAGIFFVFVSSEAPTETESGGLRFLMTMLAIFMPVAMIWVAATAARASRIMREESQRLQAAIDAIRQAYIAQQQGMHLRTEPSCLLYTSDAADE